MSDYSVLIVDDEEDYRDILLKRLKKRNIDAEGAKSGNDALEMLSSTTRDIVVMDVRMPGMTGIETLKTIKEIYPKIEVIMLTGHANMDVAMQGMELGAFDYLIKPVGLDELIFKIEDAYKKKHISESRG